MTTRRVLSSGERAATQGNRVSRYRLRVTNPNGAWLDLGALTVNGTPPKNFRQTATIAKSIDENTLQMSATVRREIGSLSLAPLKTDSPLNAGAGFTYAPALDLRRRWAIDVSVLPWNVAANLDSYRPLAEGIITALDINGEIDVGTITIAGRGMEMALLKADQLTEQQYAGAAILVRLQAMLDRWNAGVTAVAHASAPSYLVNGTTADSPQPVGSLMPALAEIAALPGAAFRYMYNASDVNELLLFTPDRNPTAADWVLGPREYKAIPGNRLDLDSVANYVTLEYYDATLAQAVTITSPAPEPSTVTAAAGAATFSVSPGAAIADGAVIVVAGVPYTVSGYTGGTTATLSGAPTFAASEWVTSASITRYGLLPFPITLAQTTNVTTFAGASALADAIRADWELPALEQQIESEGAWFLELYDYLELLPNRTHYSESQFGGVVSVTHNFAGGKLMTTVGLRGKPAGGYRSWLSFGSNAPRVQPVPTITNLTATAQELLFGSARLPGIMTIASVNQYTRSVTFEYAATIDFAAVLGTDSRDVLSDPAQTAYTTFGPTTPDTQYFIRATPYSGALSGGVPTGVAGEPVIVPLFNNRLTPGQAEYDTVVGAIGEIGTSVGDIGIPLVFIQTHGGVERLTTIPTAAAEIGSSTVSTGARRKRYLIGVGSVRLRAFAENVTGTPSLGAESSVDDFATAGDAITTLPIPGDGWHDTDWVDAPDEMKIDGFFRPTVLDGADTAAMDLRYFALEVRPALVLALRDFSDDFSDDFS